MRDWYYALFFSSKPLFNLCQTYATAHYLPIRRCFGRVISWTLELDIEIFLKFPKIFATVFLKMIKVSFF